MPSRGCRPHAFGADADPVQQFLGISGNTLTLAGVKDLVQLFLFRVEYSRVPCTIFTSVIL